MESPPITFADLILRPYVDADAEAFTAAALESVVTVGRWMPWCSSEFSKQHALDWFAACLAFQAEGSAFEYGMFCRHSGDFLGGAGLNQIVWHNRCCNLGYWVRQSRQGQGIASRCVRALSTYAFEQLKLYRVEIVVAVGNLASEKVAVKSGAVRESIARNRLYLRDQPTPAHIFSLVPPPVVAQAERGLNNLRKIWSAIR